MDTEDLAVNKLILLSILSRIPGVTLNQLVTLSLETLYMDYFDFVMAFEELCRDKLAVESVRKGEETLDAFGRPVNRCDLTQSGRTLLATLEEHIPLAIRSYLAQACSGWQKDIRLQSTLTCVCEPDANGFFQVRLKQNDGLKDLIDMRLTIPDKGMANQICDRWQRHPQTVYLGLLSLLTGEPAFSNDQPLPAHSLSFSDFSEQAEIDPELTENYPADPHQQQLFT